MAQVQLEHSQKQQRLAVSGTNDELNYSAQPTAAELHQQEEDIIARSAAITTQVQLEHSRQHQRLAVQIPSPIPLPQHPPVQQSGTGFLNSLTLERSTLQQDFGVTTSTETETSSVYSVETTYKLRVDQLEGDLNEAHRELELARQRAAQEQQLEREINEARRELELARQRTAQKQQLERELLETCQELELSRGRVMHTQQLDREVAPAISTLTAQVNKLATNIYNLNIIVATRFTDTNNEIQDLYSTLVNDTHQLLAEQNEISRNNCDEHYRSRKTLHELRDATVETRRVSRENRAYSGIILSTVEDIDPKLQRIASRLSVASAQTDSLRAALETTSQTTATNGQSFLTATEQLLAIAERIEARSQQNNLLTLNTGSQLLDG